MDDSWDALFGPSPGAGYDGDLTEQLADLDSFLDEGDDGNDLAALGETLGDDLGLPEGALGDEDGDDDALALGNAALAPIGARESALECGARGPQYPQGEATLRLNERDAWVAVDPANISDAPEAIQRAYAQMEICGVPASNSANEKVVPRSDGTAVIVQSNDTIVRRRLMKETASGYEPVGDPTEATHVVTEVCVGKNEEADRKRFVEKANTARRLLCSVRDRGGVVPHWCNFVLGRVTGAIYVVLAITPLSGSALLSTRLQDASGEERARLLRRAVVTVLPVLTIASIRYGPLSINAITVDGAMNIGLLPPVGTAYKTRNGADDAGTALLLQSVRDALGVSDSKEVIEQAFGEDVAARAAGAPVPISRLHVATLRDGDLRDEWRARARNTRSRRLELLGLIDSFLTVLATRESNRLGGRHSPAENLDVTEDILAVQRLVGADRIRTVQDMILELYRKIGRDALLKRISDYTWSAAQKKNVKALTRALLTPPAASAAAAAAPVAPAGQAVAPWQVRCNARPQLSQTAKQLFDLVGATAPGKSLHAKFATAYCASVTEPERIIPEQTCRTGDDDDDDETVPLVCDKRSVLVFIDDVVSSTRDPSRRDKRVAQNEIDPEERPGNCRTTRRPESVRVILPGEHDPEALRVQKRLQTMKERQGGVKRLVSVPVSFNANRPSKGFRYMEQRQYNESVGFVRRRVDGRTAHDAFNRLYRALPRPFRTAREQRSHFDEELRDHKEALQNLATFRPDGAALLRELADELGWDAPRATSAADIVAEFLEMYDDEANYNLGKLKAADGTEETDAAHAQRVQAIEDTMQRQIDRFASDPRFNLGKVCKQNKSGSQSLDAVLKQMQFKWVNDQWEKFATAKAGEGALMRAAWSSSPPQYVVYEANNESDEPVYARFESQRKRVARGPDKLTWKRICARPVGYEEPDDVPRGIELCHTAAKPGDDPQQSTATGISVQRSKLNPDARWRFAGAGGTVKDMTAAFADGVDRNGRGDDALRVATRIDNAMADLREALRLHGACGERDAVKGADSAASAACCRVVARRSANNSWQPELFQIYGIAEAMRDHIWARIRLEILASERGDDSADVDAVAEALACVADLHGDADGDDIPADPLATLRRDRAARRTHAQAFYDVWRGREGSLGDDWWLWNPLLVASMRRAGVTDAFELPTMPLPVGCQPVQWDTWTEMLAKAIGRLTAQQKRAFVAEYVSGNAPSSTIASPGTVGQAAATARSALGRERARRRRQIKHAPRYQLRNEAAVKLLAELDLTDDRDKENLRDIGTLLRSRALAVAPAPLTPSQMAAEFRAAVVSLVQSQGAGESPSAEALTATIGAPVGAAYGLQQRSVTAATLAERHRQRAGGCDVIGRAVEQVSLGQPPALRSMMRQVFFGSNAPCPANPVRPPPIDVLLAQHLQALLRTWNRVDPDVKRALRVQGRDAAAVAATLQTHSDARHRTAIAEVLAAFRVYRRSYSRARAERAGKALSVVPKVALQRHTLAEGTPVQLRPELADVPAGALQGASWSITGATAGIPPGPLPANVTGLTVHVDVSAGA